MSGADWATQLNYLDGPLRVRFIGGNSVLVHKEGMNITGNLLLAKCLDNGYGISGGKLLINLANVISMGDEIPKEEDANVQS